MQLFNAAETVMITVEDVDENGSMTKDEYYFSYFMNARLFFDDLKRLKQATLSVPPNPETEVSDKATFQDKTKAGTTISPANVIKSVQYEDAISQAHSWNLIDWWSGLSSFRANALMRPRKSNQTPASSNDEQLPTRANDLLIIFPSLPSDFHVVGSFVCYLVSGVFPKLGRISIIQSASGALLIFYSRLAGVKSKAFIPFKDIINVQHESGIFRFGILISTKDETELWFEFHSAERRNRCVAAIKTILDSSDSKTTFQSDEIIKQPTLPRTASFQSFRHFREASLILHEIHRQDKNFATAELSEDQLYQLPPLASFIDVDKDLVIRPPKPKIITCLTIGTRGDVQRKSIF